LTFGYWLNVFGFRFRILLLFDPSKAKPVGTERQVKSEMDQAIDKALVLLASTQDREGAWTANNRKNPAISALAVMAFLSAGHIPGEGKYGDNVKRGDPLLEIDSPDVLQPQNDFIASIADQPRFEAFTIKEGRRPRTADEATIDSATADKHDFKIGGKKLVVDYSTRTSEPAMPGLVAQPAEEPARPTRRQHVAWSRGEIAERRHHERAKQNQRRADRDHFRHERHGLLVDLRHRLHQRHHGADQQRHSERRARKLQRYEHRLAEQLQAGIVDGRHISGAPFRAWL
jgi:hypothetical protein